MVNPCCRLCGYNTFDLVNLYTMHGEATEYVRKINRYLYLMVTSEDDLPKAICWMCSQQLDSFHRFHTKINEIQQKILRDCYSKYIIEANLKQTETGRMTNLQRDSEYDQKAAEEYATIQLVPSRTTNDSFILVKTESTTFLADEAEQTRRINTQQEQESSLVEAFEIRRNTRRNDTINTRSKKCQKKSQLDKSYDKIRVNHADLNVQKYPECHQNSTKQHVAKSLELEKVETLARVIPTATAKAEQAKPVVINVQQKLTKVVNVISDELGEGDSENEFPARDSDNEEWPAAETMERFPAKIIQDGLVTVKGKELMQMINRFYNLLCDFCEGRPKRFKYDTPGGLSAHKKNVHVNPQSPRISHVCEICANKFATSSGLKEHMLTIHQPREKGLMQCPECSKWLMNNRCLKVHMQLHSKENVQCDQCSYTTKKQSLLRRHKITHHQEERPFYCGKCGSTFKHKRSLTVHISTKHGKEKHNYKCNFCDRTFASSTNFYTHRKNRHPDELTAMKEQQEQEKKLQRIKAGIEPDDIPSPHESTITTAANGTRIITISNRDYDLQEPMTILDCP
ncbi:zinc finger and BTB domain-containing protein 49-like isoform X2 [Sabethes cyaneus]|uniref:zinc finger and BTB domain-containing protein 49-like isoform X2 n=1 Tax=Sabethes cyaneus TaxID=53552 RepID=UPI00237DEFCC|nr:zinc finger and BTB domain-containing protein 49-like isoform X2 [Sabethes cyaneus]